MIKAVKAHPFDVVCITKVLQLYNIEYITWHVFFCIPQICNVQFQGSSLNGWINFIEEIGEGAEYDSVIKVKRGALSKLVKGKFIPVTEKEEKDLDAKLKKNPRAPRPIWFYVIDFKTLPLTEDDIEMATEQDIKVQKYFEGFTDKKKVEATDDSEEQEGYEQTAPEDDEEDDKDALPF